MKTVRRFNHDLQNTTPSGSNVFVRRCGALNVHSRLTALRADLRFPDVPAATDAAVISRFINALESPIDTYQKR
ncbi:YagK/YfjJ domain-containing protein [Escherichia coli]